MTDDDIKKAWDKWPSGSPLTIRALVFARAIETIVRAEERERCEDELDAAKSLREYEVTARAEEFEKLLNSQKGLEPEFAKILHDNLGGLIK